MSEELEVLKSINAHLQAIVGVLSKQPLSEILNKANYSSKEIAALTHSHGIQAYEQFTIRHACNDGRIRGVEKRRNGSWSIPQDVALRILEEGIPPERRNGNGKPR